MKKKVTPPNWQSLAMFIVLAFVVITVTRYWYIPSQNLDLESAATIEAMIFAMVIFIFGGIIIGYVYALFEYHWMANLQNFANKLVKRK